MTYPILEFDPSPSAFIEPSTIIKAGDLPEHCVVSFFKEVIDQVATEHGAKIVAKNHWEDGLHNIYEIEYQGQRLAFFHPGVGGPVSSGLLEEAIAFGCRKFIVCGGCGVLEKDIAVGHIIVVSGAVRDEGVSYHYLPPGREVVASQAGIDALVNTLTNRGIPYLVGKTWTTDAPYRETINKIQKRRAEGCLAVEMESASLIAVAQFRNVLLGQALYGGDDLSGAEWDNRQWQSRSKVRKNLFWLCADACLSL